MCPFCITYNTEIFNVFCSSIRTRLDITLVSCIKLFLIQQMTPTQSVFVFFFRLIMILTVGMDGAARLFPFHFREEVSSSEKEKS